MTIEQLVCASCGATSDVPVPDDGSAGAWECSARIAAPEGSPEGTADSACEFYNEIPGTPLKGEIIIAPGERSAAEAVEARETGHPALAQESATVTSISDVELGRGGDTHSA